MSDALSGEVPFDFLEEEVVRAALSADGLRHRWLWLTKQPGRMARFSDGLRNKGVAWPENLWAGTSITTQGTTPRIDHLLRVGHEKTIRFLSVEPQLEAVDLARWLPQIGWVIQGGESGRKARPFHTEWAIDLARRCRDQGVPYFLKQLGSCVVRDGQRVRFRDHHAGDWSEWPEQLRLRQVPACGGTNAPALPPPNPREARRTARTTRTEPGRAERRREAALKAWATRRKRALLPTEWVLSHPGGP
jgi:protein gp37